VAPTRRAAALGTGKQNRASAAARRRGPGVRWHDLRCRAAGAGGGLAACGLAARRGWRRISKAFGGGGARQYRGIDGRLSRGGRTGLGDRRRDNDTAKRSRAV